MASCCCGKTRGPEPRSYVPSTGTQALTRIQVFEQHRAVDLQIADQRELGERLDLDGLFEIVDQRGAGHARFAVDAHGAGAADLLEAIGVVCDRRGRLPSAVTGLAAISIMAEMTFMPGRHSSSNFSHTAGESGPAWRLISSATVLVAMIPQGLGPNSFLQPLRRGSIGTVLHSKNIRTQRQKDAAVTSRRCSCADAV